MGYLRRETVSASEDDAHGHIASGRKPLFWNTERNWSQDESDQGFAPSDTRRSLKEARLISRWSLVANSPQWRSLDLTMAMLAVEIQRKKYYL